MAQAKPRGHKRFYFLAFGFDDRGVRPIAA
jgi:hypothetical protein